MSCYNFITNLLHRRKIAAEMPSPSESEIVANLRLLVEEKCRELKIKEDTIHLLERDLLDKEALIRHLQNEIDKFRQVVKPITQKIITKQFSLGSDGEFWTSPHSDAAKVQQQVNEPRTKRQAISAEPLNSQSSNDLHITKIKKSAR